MNQITVDPTRIETFGNDDADSFCIVTNTEYLDRFRIEPTDRYSKTNIVAFDGDVAFENVLRDQIPEGTHILTALPNCLLHSIEPEALGRRKLLIMACCSGRTDFEGIEHFLRAGERTNPHEQEAFSERFFEKGLAAEYLELRNEQYGTVARFDHLNDIYDWHEQLGVLEWGQQQVFPAGEIACFLVPLKVDALGEEVKFDVTGQLALMGQPIVQSGPPSFLLEDQERIFERIATIRSHPVILEIDKGDVVALKASHPDAQPAADMLQALFDVDSRFRRLFEIGFAFNTEVELWQGNSAMNEVYGAQCGMIHVGLGMLPFTQYHIDIPCADTVVAGKDGEVIFGGAQKPRGKMNRQRSAACPCMDY